MSSYKIKFRKETILIPPLGRIIVSTYKSIAVCQKGKSKFYNIIHIPSGLIVASHLPKKKAFSLARNLIGNRLVRSFLSQEKPDVTIDQKATKAICLIRLKHRC